MEQTHGGEENRRLKQSDRRESHAEIEEAKVGAKDGGRGEEGGVGWRTNILKSVK
jgi:hypothetical protein